MNSKQKPVWLAELGGGSSLEEIGSKAHNLSILAGFGFAVPACVFVTTLGSRCAQFESADSYLQSIDAFSQDLDQHLPSTTGWAVRSSATVEDLPGESHAGRFETLFISDAAELSAAVRKVWDSGKLAGIGPESMGVIVQRLIDADFAGVAFSHDPTRSEHGTVIEGVQGNAARFVDGELTPWRVRPGTPDIVLPDNVDMDTIKELDSGVQHLAAQLDMAIDTEWALSDGKIYWLQVRPLTGSMSAEFLISESEKADLKGLWVRINHSFAPQATLVASMNPGGYFDGPGWTSRLVNNFHYIQENKRAKESVPPQNFDKVLDEWDQWEREFEPLLKQRCEVELAKLKPKKLWDEIIQRIALSQKYFRIYSDRRFFEIRDRTEQKLKEYIGQALGEGLPSEVAMGQLLGKLGSLTEEKQRQLANLAALHATHPAKDIRDSDEWHDFVDAFGSESPTTHLFYLPALRENPDMLFAIVEQMSCAPIAERAKVDWRATATSIADGLPLEQRPDFETQLLRLRRCLLRTEDDDYALSKCTLLVREAYLEAGVRLAQRGLLPDHDDVFHMSGTELCDILSGDVESLDNALIADRKKAFLLSGRLSPPPMIINGRAMKPKNEKPATSLSGTPASPGVASGVVLVLNDPFSCVGKLLPRNSVVVAPIVTPSLAYSLIGCAAVITEIGGLASHGAIVAREMSIPAVVGVPKARAILQTGMSVTVDGSRGEINILGSHS